MQIRPSVLLRPYIKHYLFIEVSSVRELSLRIFADGNTGIVFCMDTLLSSENCTLPESFLYGQINSYKTLRASNRLSLIIVVFRPFGMSSLLNIPAITLKDVFIDYTLIAGSPAATLHEKLRYANNPLQAVNALDTYFLKLHQLRPAAPSPVVSAATGWIIKHKGQFSARELSDYTGMHQRSLQRAFNETVGLSPKRLGGIVRLHHFLGGARNAKDFTPIVYEAGYYDQAHLIREFKKLTGLTPSLYHSNVSLAVNVVSLPDENVQL